MNAANVPQTTQAAVLFKTGQPLEIIELALPALRPGQALVQIIYSGVCHSQLNEVKGRRGPDKYLPHVMGHEGSGRVLAVGENVTKVVPGDEVVLTWIQGSGADVPSNRYESGRGVVNGGAIATFMHHTVTCESRLVRLPGGLPLREAALLGCAIPTGGGIAINSGIVKSRTSVAVFGVGGVGSAAVAVAAVMGANPLIAVDVVQHKLDLARSLGATHCIDAKADNALTIVRALTAGRGVDLSIEAAGIASVMETAFGVTRYAGGICVLAGNVADGEKITIDPYDLIRGRRIRGTWGGETNPDLDIQRYIEFALDGKLNLSAMISKEYSLAGINDALDDLENGRVLRALVAMNR